MELAAACSQPRASGRRAALGAKRTARREAGLAEARARACGFIPFVSLASKVAALPPRRAWDPLAPDLTVRFWPGESFFKCAFSDVTLCISVIDFHF